jgi:hypothetical protein
MLVGHGAVEGQGAKLATHVIAGVKTAITFQAVVKIDKSRGRLQGHKQYLYTDNSGKS